MEEVVPVGGLYGNLRVDPKAAVDRNHPRWQPLRRAWYNLREMPQAHLFDPSTLEELRQFGTGDFIEQMVDLFLETTKSVPADLKKQVDDGNWSGVAFSAHSLKSGAGNLGLTGLTDSAVDIEAAAKAGDGDRVRQIAKEMPAIYEKSCAALKDYLAKP